jgi:hypothetical protein
MRAASPDNLYIAFMRGGTVPLKYQGKLLLVVLLKDFEFDLV